MKSKLAVTFILLGNTLLFAQKDSSISTHRRASSAFVSVNVGIGFAANGFYIECLSPYVGQYDGSYGTTGYTVNALGGVPLFHSRFSLAGFISFNAEPFDINQRFLDSQKGFQHQLASSSFSDFKESLFMTGLFYTVPGKSKFTIKILAGYNMCTLAGYSLAEIEIPPTRIPMTWTVTELLQPSNSSSPAFDIGISIRLLQKQHFFGIFNADFMYSQAYFDSIYNTTGPYAYTGLNGQDHYRINYNLLSFTMGLGYKF